MGRLAPWSRENRATTPIFQQWCHCWPRFEKSRGGITSASRDQPFAANRRGHAGWMRSFIPASDHSDDVTTARQQGSQGNRLWKGRWEVAEDEKGLRLKGRNQRRGRGGGGMMIERARRSRRGFLWCIVNSFEGLWRYVFGEIQRMNGVSITRRKYYSSGNILAPASRYNLVFRWEKNLRKIEVVDFSRFSKEFVLTS